VVSVSEESHDRRVGWIELAVVGTGREVGWQIGDRGVDGCLHVTRGAVDIAIDVELHDDGGVADRARGGDFSHAGDFAQPALQWRSDRVRHGLRIGPGARGEHNDGWNVDTRQGGDGEEAIRDDAGEQQAE
jgi:hypothetical protein